MSTKFKESGTWKDVTDSFIKVAGKWKKSNKSFIKVGGHWTDAANLAATKLSYDGTTATDTDGTRYLVNSVEPTTHKAVLHSGEAITLRGDGKIVLPTTGTSYAFDHKTKTFVAVTTELKDGTFGTIIKLDTNTFSQADLDAFTARPELVLEWSAGTATIPSAIVKGAKDVVYNAKGMALPVVMGAELVTGLISPINGLTLTPITNGFTLASDGSGSATSSFRFNTPTTVKVGKQYQVSFSYTMTAGTTSSTGFYQSIPALYNYSFTGSGNYLLPFKMSADRATVVMYMNASTSWSMDITNVSIKEITSPTIPLTGTHTTINTSQFGIQQIKVGTGAMNGKDDGRFIQLPLVSNGKHLLKVCTKLIVGDITNVTDTPC